MVKAAAIAAFVVAGTASHPPVIAGQATAIDTIAETPCLFEYRLWFFSFRRSATFEAPAAFTAEQCAAAAAANDRVAAIQDSDKITEPLPSSATADLSLHDAARDRQLAIRNAAYENARRKAEADRSRGVKKARDRSRLPGASIGMTREEVLTTTNWGKPQSVNTSTNARGSTEQWVYGIGQYLYFTDGRLVTIQQSN